MPGSGTFSVEATVGTAVPRDGRIMIVNNGAYGARLVEIAKYLEIGFIELKYKETEKPELDVIREKLAVDTGITHVAMVHCETTTGLLNPAEEVGQIVKEAGRIYILDAMSSFGGIPITMESTGADFLISSANKCIQGVPGFGFVVAKRTEMEATKGQARSLSLDLYSQWKEMEDKSGKWRFTSPTHTVNAFKQALDEFEEEGGVEERYARYSENQKILVKGMEGLGFSCLLPHEIHSPIITSFVYPEDDNFEFNAFYDKMKARRYVLYPGKVTDADTFRIGNIGNVFPGDIEDLIVNIKAVIEEMNIKMPA